MWTFVYVSQRRRKALLLRRVFLAGLVVTLALGVLAASAVADTSTTPAIESESASNVTEHDATLEAQIQTNGRYTGYKFQLYTIDNESYPDPYNFVQNCAFEIPEWGLCLEQYAFVPPPGLYESESQYIPEGSGDQAVSLDLASIGVTLEPGSTYHYRVLAADSGQIVRGSVQEFTTPSQSISPPPSSSSGGDVQPAPSPALVSSPLGTVDLSSPPAPTTTKPHGTGNALKLAKALKACRKEAKDERAGCARRARRKYAMTAKKR